MPAVSQRQRRFFGMLEHTPGMAEEKGIDMNHRHMHDFAATKDAGLPERKADGAVPHELPAGSLMAKRRYYRDTEPPKTMPQRFADEMRPATSMKHFEDGRKAKGGGGPLAWAAFGRMPSAKMPSMPRQPNPGITNDLGGGPMVQANRPRPFYKAFTMAR